MKKQFLSLVLVVSMMMAFIPIAVQAATSGTCGANLTWTLEVLNGNGTLTITGSGDMTNYSVSLWAPWYSNPNIKTVVIENGVTSIGVCAFQNCSSLAKVIIGNDITSIGDAAFADCSNLTSITIPNSVTSIGQSAFHGCSNLTSVAIPNSVTNIGNNAFYQTRWYDNLPNGLISIGKCIYAYKGKMPDNTSINIQDGTVSITGYAFHGCIGLTSITIPNSVTSIGEFAFFNCDNLTSIIIPDSVTSIGIYAFESCSSLTSITIPDSVTSIGHCAFLGCGSLTSINVEENNEYYSSENGVLFNKNKTELICCPGGKTGSYILPDSVTTIDKRAFMYCTTLTSVTIGNSIISIGDEAFRSCLNLSSIIIGNSVTSIGEMAFYSVPKTCVAYIPKGFDKSMMTNAGYTGTFVELSPTEVSDGAVYSLKNNDSAIMRFMWKVNFDEKQPISKLGAYIIPWGDFADITTDERAVNIQYVSPKATNGQDMQSGNTFAVDVTNIPPTEYNTSFYAVPFVNNSFFENQMINSTVNKADINKED